MIKEQTKTAFLKSKCIDLSGWYPRSVQRKGQAWHLDSSPEMHTKDGVQNQGPKLLKANKHKNFKMCPGIVIYLLIVQRGKNKERKQPCEEKLHASSSNFFI